MKTFSVLLVKLLNIASADQNKNLVELYKKNSKVGLHPSKSFFGGLVQSLAFFHIKHVHILFLSNDIIFSTLNTSP